MKSLVIWSVFVFTIFASPISSSPSNPNGAVYAKVTANGLNYINDALVRIIKEQVRTTAIPDMSGQHNSASYRVTNFRIESLELGPSSITPTSAGIRWSMAISRVVVRSDWWFRYKKRWFRHTDDGHFKATFKDLKFDVTLKISTINGKLAVIPASSISSNCASVRDIDIDVGGSRLAWLYQFIANLFERKIKAVIPPKVCSAAGKALNDWSSQVFPNMKTEEVFDVLGRDFKADYGLLDPVYQNGVTLIRFRGEFVPHPQTISSFPFAPSPFPATPNSKHFYLVMSDFVANTLLYSFTREGLGRQRFTVADLGREPMFQTILGEYCPAGSECASSDAFAEFDIAEAPKMIISKAEGIKLVVQKAFIRIGKEEGGSVEEFARVNLNSNISATPRLSPDARRLFLDFAVPEVDFQVIQPPITDPNKEKDIKEFVQFLAGRYGHAALVKFGERGVELPNVKGKIDIKNTELTAEDGALVLGADLELKF